MEIFQLLMGVYLMMAFGESSCCVRFLDSKCLECPEGMHLFRDNCIFDVKNCEIYKDGFDCERCKESFVLVDKKCVEQVKAAKELLNSPATLNKSNQPLV